MSRALIRKDNLFPIFRSDVQKRRDYRDYQENLREDFWFSCAYCNISEMEALAIGFEIDHYLPRKTEPGKVNDYHNLLWTCKKCNGMKDDFHPTHSGFNPHCYILRPDRDDPREHYEIRGTDACGTTGTGEFNVEFLDLNRGILQRIRRLRERDSQSKAFVLHGFRVLANLPVDQMPGPVKIQINNIRVRVTDRVGYVGLIEKRILKDFARSALIDVDEGKKERAKKRRDYLVSQKVKVP